ncbi:MAG: Rap1a/Tai family immunity protein [Rhizomicrobium sp.]
MKTWQTLLASVCLFCSSPSLAETNGNELYQYCQSYIAAQSNWAAGFCNGFIGSEAETLVSLQAICPSEHVTYQQAYDMVTKYLVLHPETRDQPAASLVYAALAETFPCAKATLAPAPSPN